MSYLRLAVRLVSFPLALVTLASLLALAARLAPASRRDRRRAVLQHHACRILVRLLGVRVRPVGQVPEEGAYLVASNHLGMLDAWVLAAVMPTAFVAKAEMAGWPVMGAVCRAVGVIFVDRDRRLDAGRFVGKVQSRMRGNVPVTVFPEGTVGSGRDLLPFRTGAFEAVAGGADLFVLPVFMQATGIGGRPAGPDDRERIVWHAGESLSTHIVRVLRLPGIVMEVRIGDPVAAEDRDRKALAHITRHAVRDLGADLLLPGRGT